MEAPRNKPPPKRSERKRNTKAGCTATKHTHPANHSHKRIIAHGMLRLYHVCLFVGRAKNEKEIEHGAAKEKFEEDG